MKKIKVYLQGVWKFPDSPYYKYLIGNPPSNIEYLNAKGQKGVISNKKKFLFLNFVKNLVRKSVGYLNLPLPNASIKKIKGEFDLIHCTHCISLGGRPWVADFEGAWQFWIGKKTKLGKKIVMKNLLNKHCKKILPWTELAKKDIIDIFPEIKDKVEVVYPAVPFMKSTPNKKKKGKITILYAARYFWLKGGLIALETLKKIKESHDVDIIFISDVPKEIKKNFPEIKFIDLISQKELFEYLKIADIFFYPSLVDTFGFSLLEAMAHKLPIISVNTSGTRSRKEILENGKTGFLIDFPRKELNYYSIQEPEKKLIGELFKKTVQLIENDKLRNSMAENCEKIIKNGKFSIKERNKKLEKIYSEALK
jgi:glycosyltransferase involved in cell wall biosynthesis